MNSAAEKWWLQLCKKAGLALPTLEEAEAEVRTAKPVPLSDELVNAIASTAAAGKKKGPDATSDREAPTQVRIQKADRPADKEEQSFFEVFGRIFVQIGSPRVSVVYQAINRLLKFESSHHDYLYEYIRRLLRKHKVIGSSRQVLKNAMRSLGPLARIRAYYQYEGSVSPEEARDWIEDPSTEISTLVSSPVRKIFAAIVVPPEERDFGAFWFQLSESCHVFVVSKSLSSRDDRPSVICHEFEEMREFFESSLLDKRKEDTPMKPITSGIAAQTESEHEKFDGQDVETESFAVRQTLVDAVYKQLVATYVSLNLPPRAGAGIIIDAGSACLEMWARMVQDILAGKFPYMVVYTNSFLVLQNWGKWRTSPGVRETYVELTGTSLDWEHLVFDGPEAHRKLMDPSFRAMNVYIGAAGIEFDEKTGSIRFGYRRSREEREFKELLFQCRAARRIILATPRKIGFAGGRSFDLLNTKDLNTEAPIYLVTTKPQEGSENESQFKRSLDAFQSKAVERAISERGLEFHWITINGGNEDMPEVLREITIPKKD